MARRCILAISLGVPGLLLLLATRNKRSETFCLLPRSGVLPVVEGVDYRQGAKQDELRGLLDRVCHLGKSLEDTRHLDVVQQ